MENTPAILSYCINRYPVHSDVQYSRKFPGEDLMKQLSFHVFAMLFRKIFYKQGNSAVQREHRLPFFKYNFKNMDKVGKRQLK